MRVRPSWLCVIWARESAQPARATARAGWLLSKVACVARFFDTDEIAELQRQQARLQAYETFRAMVQPQTAGNVAVLASTYPHMQPGTVLSLGKAGVQPETSVAKAAAKAEAKRGWGWHSIGDVVSGAVGAVSGAAAEVVDTVGDVAKGLSRGASMGLESVGQTFQGALRESVADGDIEGAEWFLGLPHLREGFKQTTLYAGHREVQREGGYLGLLTGRTDVDYGDGFFAGGDVRRDQVRAARAAAPLIGGKAPTVGRYAAVQVFEPGTRRYSLLSGLIDAGISLGSDPTVYLGAPVKGAIEGNCLLAGSTGTRAIVSRADGPVRPTDVLPVDRDGEAFTAGLVDGLRRTVLPERAADWLDSKRGRGLREYLAGETDFVRLRKTLGSRVPVELLPRLLDARTDADVLDVLGPELGLGIREKFGVSAPALAEVVPDRANVRTVVGSQVQRRLDSVRAYRWASKMPGSHVNLDDVQQAVEQIELFGRNVKMPDEKTGVFAERMARATDRNARYALVRDFLRSVHDEVLAERGVPADVRRKLTTMNPNHDARLRVYAIDDISQNAKVPGAVVNGELQATPTPHYFAEYINQAVPLPDARELRRATSGFVDMLEKVPGNLGIGLFRNGTALADFVNSNIFKVGALFRAAYPLRVVGEEQIRMAAAGGTSLVNHPLSHIAAILAHKKGQSTDLLGNPIEALEELSQALSRNAALGIERTGVVRSRGRTVLRREDEGFAAALLDELAKGANDPVQRRVLNGLGDGDQHPNTALTGLDAVRDWFFDGTGRSLRNQMGSSPGREFFAVKTDPDDPVNSADGYIDSLLQRARTVTGGDAVLMEAMATGRIGGEPLTVVTQGGARKANPQALRLLERHLASGVGPQVTPADILLHAKGTAAGEIGAKYNAVVDHFFDKMMGIPTDTLSRAPAFEQAYWKRQAELVEFMQPEVQRVALEIAERNKSAQPFLKAMRKRAAGGTGRLTAAEADTLAKAFAVESTKALLYDLSKRSQWADIYRNFFPFGAAWQEVATTWARITVKQNPLVLRRGQQIVTGGRSADLDGDGQGFFHPDESGEREMFSYPFTGWLSEKLTGVPAPMQAPVSGLNLFASSVLPGFGPVVTIPAAKLLPGRPEWQGVRDVLMPFGEKDLSGGVLESFLPPWVQKARVWLDADSPAQERQYANTLLDVTRYLVSTGKYSMSSAEEQARLLRDAKDKARSIYGLRALAQFFAPSPPSPQFVVQDKDGNAMLALKLSEAYRKMLDEDAPSATERFVERFGEAAFLSTIGKSEGGGPPTDEALEFVQRNPETVARHGDVYGYFMPQDGEFSYEAYKLQLVRGSRRPITAEQAIQIANQRLGAMIYRIARARVTADPRTGKPRPNAAERTWLAQVRDAIEQEYPGYSPIPTTLGQTDRTITKLVAAVKDPNLADTEAGQGLSLYLRERERALEIARSRGLSSFKKANAARDLRAVLRQYADELAERYPDFGELFERTLNREMVADSVEPAVAA
jgi:hypothetical protein